MGGREQLSKVKTRHQFLQGKHEAGIMQNLLNERSMSESASREEGKSSDGFFPMTIFLSFAQLEVSASLPLSPLKDLLHLERRSSGKLIITSVAEAFLYPHHTIEGAMDEEATPKEGVLLVYRKLISFVSKTN